MTKYITQRVLLFLPIMFGISVVVFAISHLIPGDPVLVMLGQEATPDEADRLRALLGLDQSLPIQYVRWVARLLRGDLGKTLFGGQQVIDLLVSAFPATIELTLTAMLLGVIVALPLGILSAVYRGSAVDYGGMILALLGVSMPVFWLGLLLILFFALRLGWLPFNGRGTPLAEAMGLMLSGQGFAPLVDSLRHLALPGLALATHIMGPLARVTRSSMLEVMNEDFIQVARAKGLREREVILRHALKNALLPVVTVMGLQFGVLLGGAIATEIVFAWPGVGRLVVTAILQNDYAVSQGGVLLMALVFSLVNLLIDLSYGYLNPKIRYGD